MRKFRSITSSANAASYAGPFGEIVVDDTGTLRIQDNVTPGGHTIASDTGNIRFVDSTISTADPVDLIFMDSRRLIVSSEIAVGNLLITNDNISVITDAISITAGLHTMEFRDVSAGNVYINTGAVLKFDNVLSSDGPTFATWYGAEGDPYDPPGQHSLDIRAGSDSPNDYVEFASFDWDTYMGVTKQGGHIFTNWNADRTQSWKFNKAGEFVLPPIGIITSANHGSNLTVLDSNITIQATNQNTNTPFSLLIENSNFVFDGNVLPSGNATVDLGSPDFQWRHLYVSSNTIYVGGAPLTVTNGELSVNGNVIGGGTVYDQSLNINDNVTFNSVASNAYVNTPEYRLGNTIKTTTTAATTVLGAASSVVYAFDSFYTSAKFVIQVEGRIDSDMSTDHTQTCEATVAATYNTNAEPIMSVYGIVYTTVAPLATFTVRRGTGAATGKIEILATNSQTTSDLIVKVYALQFVSRYD